MAHGARGSDWPTFGLIEALSAGSIDATVAVPGCIHLLATRPASHAGAVDGKARPPRTGALPLYMTSIGETMYYGVMVKMSFVAPDQSITTWPATSDSEPTAPQSRWHACSRRCCCR